MGDLEGLFCGVLEGGEGEGGEVGEYLCGEWEE